LHNGEGDRNRTLSWLFLTRTIVADFIGFAGLMCPTATITVARFKVGETLCTKLSRNSICDWATFVGGLHDGDKKRTTETTAAFGLGKNFDVERS